MKFKNIILYLLSVILLANVQIACSIERPLIFIPGILGSVLENTDGVVWGDAYSLNRLDQLTIIDGPRDPNDDLKATGVIKTIQILGPIKIKQYDELFNILNEIGFVTGQNLFVFAYDWRQSNFTSAKQLADFIANTPILANGEFDILAHSMGGLVSLIYIHEHNPNQKVRRLITMGTPFLGAAQIIGSLEKGWGFLSNRLTGGITTIRRTILSFPSIYELLPDYDNCCILGTRQAADRTPFDLLSPQGWSKLKWLTEEDGSKLSNKEVRQSLTNAQKLRSLANRVLPPDIKLFKIAGDHFQTPAQFYVDPKSGTIDKWNDFKGDSTVPLFSATNIQQEGAVTSFLKHSRIFEDEHVKTFIQRILTEDVLIEDYNAQPSLQTYTLDGTPINLESIKLNVQPTTIQQGDSYTVSISLYGEPNASIDKIAVKATLLMSDQIQVPLEVNVHNLQRTSQSSIATYKATGEYNRGLSGIATIIIDIPSIQSIEDYIFVLGK